MNGRSGSHDPTGAAVAPWSPWLGVGASVAGQFVAGVVAVAVGSRLADGTFDLEVFDLLAVQSARWVVFAAAVVVAVRAAGSLVDLAGRHRAADAPVGLALGIATQLAAIPALYTLIEFMSGPIDVDETARELFDSAGTTPEVIGLVAMVVVGAPIAEELLYRGVIQRPLIQNFGPVVGLAGAAGFFALVHLQVVEFPGLLLAGLVFGYLAWRFDRLAPAVWAHVGFNGTTALVLLT